MNKTDTKKTENAPDLHWEDVKTIEFERVLNLYGMKKEVYCKLHTKSRTWWNNVLMKRKGKILLYKDIKLLADNIGTETFNMLLEKVRNQHKKEK